MVVNIEMEMRWLRDHGLCDGYTLLRHKDGIIRSVVINACQWFEVDTEPCMAGCYVYSSNRLSDCCEYLGIPYYNKD